MKSPGSEVIVYESGDGEAHMDVRLKEETVWMTQYQMAEVFQTMPRNVQMHLRNIFSSQGIGRRGNYQGFLDSSSGRQAKGPARAQAL